MRIASTFALGLALAASMTSANVAHAQQPSLSETKDWITQSSKYGFVMAVDGGVEQIDFPGPDKCSVRFTVLNSPGEDGPKHDLIRFMQEANLADIDPASIVAGPAKNRPTIRAIDFAPTVFVSVETYNHRDAVTHSMPSFGDHDTQPYYITHMDEIGWETADAQAGEGASVTLHGIAVHPEYAPHFVNAMRHAVELCGGKSSPF
jgi:hypothetical protein